MRIRLAAAVVVASAPFVVGCSTATTDCRGGTGLGCPCDGSISTLCQLALVCDGQHWRSPTVGECVAPDSQVSDTGP